MRSNRLSYTPDFAEASSGKPVGFRKLTSLRPSFAGLPPEALAEAGGGNRVRTGDPKLAKLVLYQLSYAPESGTGQPSRPFYRIAH